MASPAAVGSWQSVVWIARWPLGGTRRCPMCAPWARGAGRRAASRRSPAGITCESWRWCGGRLRVQWAEDEAAPGCPELLKVLPPPARDSGAGCLSQPTFPSPRLRPPLTHLAAWAGTRLKATAQTSGPAEVSSAPRELPATFSALDDRACRPGSGPGSVPPRPAEAPRGRGERHVPAPCPRHLHPARPTPGSRRRKGLLVARGAMELQTRAGRSDGGPGEGLTCGRGLFLAGVSGTLSIVTAVNIKLKIKISRTCQTGAFCHDFLKMVGASVPGERTEVKQLARKNIQTTEGEI